MSENLDWGAYVRGTIGRYVTRYLAYTESHSQPTAADYDALETERSAILVAMDCAYQEEQWKQTRRFAWAFCQPVDGFLSVRGYWGELRARLEQAIRAAEADGHPRDDTAFVGNLATVLKNTGNLTAAHQEYLRVQTIFEKLGERESVAAICHQLGVLAQDTGDYAEARRLYRQSLEIDEELGDRAGIAQTLHNLGAMAQRIGGYAEARRLYRQSLDIEKELGNKAGIASSLGQLANLAGDEGDLIEAERLYRRVTSICKELGDIVTESITLFNLAQVCEAQGRLDEALPLLERAVEIAEQVGMPQSESRRRALERVRERLAQ